MDLKEFNRSYIYKRDKANFGFREVWRILTPNDQGKYVGDCEDYVLTLKHRVPGFEDMQIYYCKLIDEGHAVGKINGQWIDSYQQTLLPEFDDRYTAFRKMTWLEIKSKMLIGWIVYQVRRWGLINAKN